MKAKLPNPKPKRPQRLIKLSEVFNEVGKHKFADKWTGQELTTEFVPSADNFTTLLKRKEKLEKDCGKPTNDELKKSVAIAEISGDAYSRDEETYEYHARMFHLLELRKLLAKLPPTKDIAELHCAFERRMSIEDELRTIFGQGEISTWEIGEDGKRHLVDTDQWFVHVKVKYPPEGVHKKYSLSLLSDEIGVENADLDNLLQLVNNQDEMRSERPDRKCQDFLVWFMHKHRPNEATKGNIKAACEKRFKTPSGRPIPREKFNYAWNDAIRLSKKMEWKKSGSKGGKTAFDEAKILKCIDEWKKLNQTNN